MATAHGSTSHQASFEEYGLTVTEMEALLLASSTLDSILLQGVHDIRNNLWTALKHKATDVLVRNALVSGRSLALR